MQFVLTVKLGTLSNFLVMGGGGMLGGKSTPPGKYPQSSATHPDSLIDSGSIILGFLPIRIQ
jgi:hypothetical protein